MAKTFLRHLLQKASLKIQQRISHDPQIFQGVPRQILAHYLQVDPSYCLIHPHDELPDSVVDAFESDLELYLTGTPLSRLRQCREFWSLPFHLSEATLDPRPETEHVVEVALARLSHVATENKSPFILDLGTGSGCILLSLLHEMPNALGIGVDLSWDALDTARLNARELGLFTRTDWVQSFWGKALKGPFSLIVSNPPYISGPQMKQLSPVVSTFDPYLALYGGSDGLEAYEEILASAPSLLDHKGTLVVEIGYTQAKDVTKLFNLHGFQDIQVHQDLELRDRVISGKLPE